MKAGKTFTYDELRHQIKLDHGNADITDEEIEASIHIFLHLGFIRKKSRDIYETTGKKLEEKDVF